MRAKMCSYKVVLGPVFILCECLDPQAKGKNACNLDFMKPSAHFTDRFSLGNKRIYPYVIPVLHILIFSTEPR